MYMNEKLEIFIKKEKFRGVLELYECHPITIPFFDEDLIVKMNEN